MFKDIYWPFFGAALITTVVMAASSYFAWGLL